MAGQDSKVQILINFADVVVPAQSLQSLSAVVHCVPIARGPETCRRTCDVLVKPDPLVPVMEVVVVAGEPVWRLCAGGHCVESRSGAGAWLELRRLCLDKGIILAVTGVTLPTVGPPPLPDPGT